MNYYATVKNFLENRRDTSNNRFKTYKPVAERLANYHHFMKLVNDILPNLMPTSALGKHNGISKIKPNYFNVDAENDVTVKGIIWLNTVFEADCFATRLEMLMHCGAAVKIDISEHGRNQIVKFSIILSEIEHVKPVAEDANSVEEARSAEHVNLETEKEICESIFFSEAIGKAIHTIRGALHFGSKRLKEIDCEIAKLQALRKEVEDNMKIIKNSIGA
jgi:hypothetical protein